MGKSGKHIGKWGGNAEETWKNMGLCWEKTGTYGKHMGKLWEHGGKMLWKHGKIQQKIWKHMETWWENDGKMVGKCWENGGLQVGKKWCFNNFFHGERRISWFKHRFIAMSLLHHQNGAIYQQLFNGLVEGKN